MMMAERRSIGRMLYKRRHSGSSATERQEENQLWKTIIGLLTAIIAVLRGIDQAVVVAG
jgi:hypothetical protein